jgi:DNA-binding transcriptional ArsR family regulator
LQIASKPTLVFSKLKAKAETFASELFAPIFTGYSGADYLSLDFIKHLVYNMSMDMFVALADPTRRAILEILASGGELSASAIYEHFSVSPQAISQHLKVLREANLVVMEKRAQKHLYRLNQETLAQFEAWVQQTRQRWEERFSALDTILEREKQKFANDEQKSR